MVENFTHKQSDLTVLIMSYDGFSDTWDACDKCFKKYWKAESPVYIATNQLEPDFEFLKVFKIGGKSYSQGINQFAVNCKSEYILLLMADFLPSKVIDGSDLNALLEVLKNESADYCSIYKQKDKIKYYNRFKTYKNLLLIDKSVQYSINVMPALWKTSLLAKLTEGENLNPWEFELSFQKDSRQSSIMGETLNFYCLNKIYPLCHTIVKGKYTKDGVKFLKKEKISVDYKKRKKMNAFENLKLKIADSLPRKFKDSLKKILKKFGFKFYA